MLSDPFDTADFYGGVDDDELDYESPEEYLHDVFAYAHVPDDLTGFEVVAYRRREFDQATISRLAESAADHLRDEYCDGEVPYPRTPWKLGSVVQDLTRAFKADIARVFRGFDHCVGEEVARRTYTREEIVAILRCGEP